MGADIGLFDGLPLREALGLLEGLALGEALGLPEGLALEEALGLADWSLDGCSVGCPVHDDVSHEPATRRQ